GSGPLAGSRIVQLGLVTHDRAIGSFASTRNQDFPAGQNGCGEGKAWCQHPSSQRPFPGARSVKFARGQRTEAVRVTSSRDEHVAVREQGGGGGRAGHNGAARQGPTARAGVIQLSHSDIAGGVLSASYEYLAVFQYSGRLPRSGSVHMVGPCPGALRLRAG